MEINTLNQNMETTLKGNVETNFALPKATGNFSDIKTNLKELIESIISPKGELSIDDEINNKFLNLDFGAEFNIDAVKIGEMDAVFFVNLLNQENLINYTVQDNKITLFDCDNKRIDATNSLLTMLQSSYETKKAIRLDFDRDITVILKLDKEGKIQAHFIPGTSEVESYIKNNINALKQRFEEENINYSSLSYSQNKNKENKKNKRST